MVESSDSGEKTLKKIQTQTKPVPTRFNEASLHIEVIFRMQKITWYILNSISLSAARFKLIYMRLLIHRRFPLYLHFYTHISCLRELEFQIQFWHRNSTFVMICATFPRLHGERLNLFLIV